MRLGILGGSFDPVHNGHLALARACHKQAQLQEVWFMPTSIQPLKRQGPCASDSQRVEMLQLAIDSEFSDADDPHPRTDSPWRVCTLEIDRGGISYTADTMRHLHTELPTAHLFFMIGADAVREVPRWREPAEIFQRATPLVVCRAGQPTPDLTALTALCSPETAPQLVEMPLVDVSSSQIRQRLAAGEPIDGLVPPAVAQYILQHAMYRPA
jgi:nicotinate-nucleotide adenylyltransferase